MLPGGMAIALSATMPKDMAGRGTMTARRGMLAHLLVDLLVALGCVACGRSLPDGDEVSSRRAAVTLVDQGSVLSADTLRTGWYSDQPLLDPITVSSPYFGQIFDAPVDGEIYAQPLYVNGAVLVATETNHVYALDAATGGPLWTRQLAPPWNAADLNCSNLVPTVGVTGTPAIDATTQTAYLLSKTYASGGSGAAAWYAHALDLATGDERAGFPVEIAGAASNDPDQVFNPTQQLQRPGLLLMNGVVYAAFGGHCDLPPYAGWVVGISAKGVITTLWTSEAGAARTDGGGIWMSGGGLVSDRAGDLLFATSNDGSQSTTPVAGHQPPETLGEAIVRLSVRADGSLAPVDFFSPAELPALNQDDADLGSGAPIALPAPFGTASHPNLMALAGKEGYLYLLDRDDLGGYLQGAAGADRVLQRLGPDGGVWSRPGVWPGDGGYVYVPVVSGCSSPTDAAGCLRAYQYGVSGDDTPTLSLSAVSTTSFGYGSSAVVVTSDGTRSGSALLWTIWSAGPGSTASQLRAYDAVPDGAALKLRYLAGVGVGGRFTAPAVGAGRVYVGTGDGHLLGFGVTGTPALRAEGVAFAPTVVGDVLVSDVHVIASGRVEIASLGTTGDFALADAAPSVPFTAMAGDTVVIPIAFRPTAEGADVGALQVTTDHGTFTIPLAGVGQSPVPRLAPAPAVVSFAPLEIGGVATSTVEVTNVSEAPMTISSTTPPRPPFSIDGLPAVGAVMGPGASFTATITFAPTSVGSSSGTFSVAASGAVVAVAVGGSAVAGGKLRVAPEILDLGAMRVGDVATSVFQLTNVGDVPLVIEKSQPPASPAFVSQTALPEGTILAPGASREQLVRVSPTAVGPVTDVWRLNADDGQGLRDISFTVLGLEAPPAPPPETVAQMMSVPVGPTGLASNNPSALNRGGNGEVVGHACSAAGDVGSSGLLGLGLIASALALVRRRARR
jgi:outer membrane protein assembly factor BamB